MRFIAKRFGVLSAAIALFCLMAALPASVRAQSTPAKPTGFRTQDGNTQVRLRWTGPNDPTVTGWQYTYKPESGSYSDWMDIPESGPDTRRYTVTELENNTFYTFRIRAVNAAGPGAQSDEKIGNPYFAAPEKPIGFQAMSGDGKIILVWDDSDDVSIKGWEYKKRKSNEEYGEFWSIIPSSNASTTSYTVDNLENDTEYTFIIRAYNNAGAGEISDERAAAPMLDTPGKPTGFSIEAGNRKVTLRWNNLVNKTIVKWQYAYKTTGNYSAWSDIPGSGSETTHHVVSDLENDISYTFRIRAVNAVGAGAVSDSISATPMAAAPEKPQGFTAEAGDTKITLTWADPSDASITKWQYAYKTAGDYGNWTDIPESAAATTRHTVSGLANGTIHMFKLRAVNEVGEGAESDEASATPLAVPAKPVGFAVSAKDGQADLEWSDPLNASITGWQYTFRTSGNYGAWIDIPGSNAATDSHTVSGLANGIPHRFRIRAMNGSGHGAESDEIAVIPQPVPEKPAGFSAVAGNMQVRLTWTDPGDSSITVWQYSIEITGDYGEWTDIPGSDAGTSRYTVTGLANDTAYTFRIRAVNGIGAGPESDEISATPRAAAPEKPTGFEVRAGDGQAVLQWDDPDDFSIQGWQYTYKLSGGAYPEHWRNIPASDANTTFHTVTGLTNGASHIFKIRAVNNVNGYESDERAVTPQSLRPAKPTGFTARPGDGQALLEWDDPGDSTITGWQYRAGTAGNFGPWTDIAGSAATTTAHRITGLANGTAYAFRLRAVNANGNGDESGEATATPRAAPAKPTGFTATPGDGEALLEWNDPQDPSITGWQYRAGTAGSFGPWTNIAGSAATTTAHRVSGLTNGTAYAFKLRAVNASGNGAESDEATATPLAVPAKPTGFAATPGDGLVLLEWGDPNDSTITGWQYRVGTAGSFGPWTDIAGSNADTVAHRVIGLTNGLAHIFKLRAVNNSGPGAESDETAATPLAMPAKPTGFTATPGDGQVLLKWDDPNDSTVTGWQYRAGTAGSFDPWADIDSSNAATTAHRVTGLINGTAYVFKLRAVNASGPGAESGEASATPLAVPSKPTDFTATPGDGHALLEWDDPNDATITGWQYRVGTAGSFGPWTDVNSSNAATTAHQVTGLSNGTAYAFKLRAVNASGPGAESDEATATPLAAPAKPTGLTVTPGDRQVSLKWDDPSDPIITGWEYNQRQSGGNYAEHWTFILGSDAGTVSYTVKGLENGKSYGFKIRAANASGSGAESDEAVAVLPRVPAQPQGLKAVAGDGQVLLEWQALGDPTVTVWQYRVGTREDDGSWTDIPGSGAETVAYSVGGLANGTNYSFRIRAVNSSGPGAASGEAIAMPLAVPAKPTGFAATPGIEQALLEWDDPSDPAITGWEYNQRQAGGNYAEHWTFILGSGAGTVAHTVTGLENGKSYGFMVRAVNASGSGAESDEAVAVLPAAPRQPQGLKATPGDEHVLLQWRDLGDATVTGWQYHRIATPEDNASWTDIPDSGAEMVEHSVTGLVNETEYGFRIRAVNSSGPGAASVEAFATPFALPGKPTGFAATPGIEKALLEWDNPQDPTVTGWEYKQRRADGNYEEYWTPILGSDAGTVSHTVTGLENGASYSFKIRAVAGGRIGPESDEAAVSLLAAPAQPQGLTATPGDGQALLEWRSLGDPTVTVWQYRVGTAEGDGLWIDIPGSGAETARHAVTGLVNETEYGFRIRAVNANGHSAQSDEVFATPFAVPAKPASLTAAPGDGLAQLKWSALNDPTVTGWEYKQRRADGNYEEYWTLILGSDAGTVSHTVTGLENGVLYSFKIRAVAGGRIGPESDEVVVSPLAAPAQPQGLTATPGDGQVLLQWLDPKNPAITGWQYRYRTTAGFGGWIDMEGADPATLDYTVSGLENGIAHIFQIRARTAVGAGPPSEEATPATPAAELAAPTGLKALPGDGQVQLIWNAGNNPAGVDWQYGVWEMTENGPVERLGGIAIGGPSSNPCERSPWIDIAGNDAAETRYTVSNLTNGITYAFRVRSFLNGKCSEESDGAYATPVAVAGKRERAAVKSVLANLAGKIAAGAEAVVATRFAAEPAAARLVIAGHEAPAFAPARRQAAGPASIGGAPAASRRMSAFELLRGSAAQIPLGRTDREDAVRWAVWQRGDMRAFRGSAGPRAPYGGAVLSGWLGVDARLGRQWLVGAALARSEGEIDYAAGQASGVIETTLNSIHPYMHWRFRDGATLWATLGGGRGAIGNISAGRGGEKAALRMATISTGLRSPLPAPDGVTLSVSGAAGFTQIETDGDAQTAIGAVSSATDRQSVRLDATLEAGWASPYVSAAARRDGGGGARGAGLELAGGLRLALPPSSTHVDIRARWLAWHSDRDYREYGFSAAARRPVERDSRGPSWRLSAAVGIPDSAGGAAEALWRAEAPESGGAQAPSLAARAGWGFASDVGIVTAYAGLGFAAGNDRYLALGLDMGLPHRLLLELAAERRLPRLGAAENRVTARLKLTF